MKIAITGASGHIGANLCRTLSQQGHSLKVLVNQYKASLEGLDLEHIEGSILDPGKLTELASGCDVFIHLAASISINGSELVHDINLEGTRNVVNAVTVNAVKKLIHFSSIHALIQEPLNQVLDETRTLAVNDPVIYNRSKAKAEQLVLEAVDRGLDAVILNPTSVMGPNDFKPSLVGQAIIRLYRGEIPALVPGGYDWVDVRDVVSGTVSAIERGKPGHRYLLSGHYVSLEDMYSILQRLKGNGKKLPVLPFWMAEIGVPFLKLWSEISGKKALYTRESVKILKTAHKNISPRKAMEELDYSIRPFEETLEDTLNWFRDKSYL